jgi:exonuclease VII small subunit
MSKKPSIDEKMKSLRELVAWFEGEDFVLEQAGEKFTAATKLANEIETELSTLKNSVTVLKEKFDN